MKRIAFINQRYGLEVNGGSEYYTRLIAEHINQKYDVEILTTKAVDSITWQDYYKDDLETINGITVRRFNVEKTRDIDSFAHFCSEILNNNARTEEDEYNWLIEQGPFCPSLVRYIREHANEYDLFIFVTYLYYTSYAGIGEVTEKAVIIPTAHDEPYIHFNIFKNFFQKAQGIVYLTDEEKYFVERLFNTNNVNNVVAAIGIDMLENQDTDDPSLPYIIYVGRIENLKGCDILFDDFIRYKKENPGDLKLVLIGKSVIDIPEHPDIIYLGFVNEEEKCKQINNAKALILPSQFESLSISVLEALQVETPIIVNGKCEVLKGHCRKSNAGLYYTDYFEFENCLNYIVGNEDIRKHMGQNGKEYVNKYYRWDVVLDKLERLFDSVIDSQNR